MAFRNPLRPGHAVLLCASVSAFFTAGCNVYDDELLRRSEGIDGGASDSTARPLDVNTADKVPAADGATRRDGDNNELDVTPTDAPSFPEGGPINDASALDAQDAATRSDGATPDGAAPDAATRDAIAVNDVADGPSDASTGTHDSGATPDTSVQDVISDSTGGTSRDANEGGGAIDVQFDGAAPPPTFRVVRVGDGATALSAASAPVFIEERRWDGSIVAKALALPTAEAGAEHALTIAGNATSEGALALSLDARFLTLAGYAAVPGRASIASSTDVDRVAARIDATGTIDTTTLLGNAFSGSNVRSATSLDGTGFWIGGTGDAGGVWYFPLRGAPGAQIVTSPNNVRLVALFGDRLYGSSGASPMASVFTVGTGRPTAGAQNVAALAGMPRSGMSPYAFALFDLNTAVAGMDTLYLTDDRSPETDGSGGGIQKWTFDGSAWTRVATFSALAGGTASFRGLAAALTPAGVTLVATTAETSANRLVVFVDDGAAASGTVIATAPSNTIFRGVALSPHP